MLIATAWFSVSHFSFKMSETKELRRALTDLLKISCFVLATWNNNEVSNIQSAFTSQSMMTIPKMKRVVEVDMKYKIWNLGNFEIK
jgi:hypothetical protein